MAEVCHHGQEDHRQRREGHRRQAASRSCWRWSPGSAKGTSCSKTCRAWPRRCSPGRWPASVGCSFKRMQCTPDLLPTDVTGASIFNPEDDRVRVSRRADLRADRAGRRNQSRHAAHASRAAGSDGRRPRDGRRHDARAGRAVPGDRHAKPRRPRRDVSAARGAARPLSGAVQPGLSEPGRRTEDARPAASTAIRSTTAAGRHGRPSCVACQQAVREVHVDEKVRRYIMRDRPRHARARRR